MTLDDRITALLEREQGFVDNLADSGGPTNWGVTQKKLGDVLGRPATLEDVRNLTREEARWIYRKDFEVAQLDILENHGPGNFAKILQRALGVTVDGEIGPKTRAALAAADGKWLFRNLCAERMEFTGGCVTKNLKDDDHDGIPDNTEFAWGWLVRQAGFVRKAP